MKNNPHIEERRKFLRIPRENIIFVSPGDVLEELELKEGSEKVPARTKDISAGGLLFESPKLFEIEKILKIEMTLPHWEKYKKTLFKSQFCYPTKPFLVLGKVVRVEFLSENSYDVGISFAGIEEDYRDILLHYINDRKQED